jgi:hypothetical protein
VIVGRRSIIDAILLVVPDDRERVRKVGVVGSARWSKNCSPSSHSTTTVPCTTTPARAGWVDSVVQLPSRRSSGFSSGDFVIEGSP